MQPAGTSVMMDATGSPSIATLPGSERIVFALEDEIKAHFLPLLEAAALPGAQQHWIDPRALDKTQRARLLLDLRPTVLVTGWGSPAVPEEVAALPGLSLRYLCHLNGSVRHFVPRRLIERGVVVSNWGTTVSSAVAEHAMLLVLAALRSLPAWAEHLDRWADPGDPGLHVPLETCSLRGKRVGLHGFGSIARELAAMLRPFGVTVAAYSRGVPPELFARHGVRRANTLEELFSGSDVLIECEALTAASQGAVDERTLRCLPDDAVFVNVGRGQVVDEDALARVAVEKRLRLGLDVFVQEPLPMDSPLRRLPAALLSPHIAGPTRDGLAGLCRFALENIRRYLRGESIQAQVSLEIYDRAT